jgi:hypothetical protein
MRHIERSGDFYNHMTATRIKEKFPGTGNPD